MDTEIFQFGQRGVEKIEFKDLKLISKSLLFSHITALLIFLGELASLTTVFSGIF